MANKYYSLNEEFDVQLNLKIKLNQASDYHQLSKKELQEIIKEVKENISNYLEFELKKKQYQQVEDIAYGCDYIDFEII